MTASQISKVLRALQAGQTITPLTALDAGMGFRLSSHIHKLRQRGYGIETTIIKAANGNTHAAYRLLDDSEVEV